jgi:Ca2+-binding EF-hand superfamily protein
MFDPNWKGHLTLSDLKESFFKHTNGHSFRPNDMFLIFQRYDRDQDGKLRYSEFADLMQPSNMLYRKSLLERRSQGPFQDITLDLVHKVLLIHLKVEQGHENLRQRLHKKKGKYVLSSLFKDIDLDNKGYLAISDIIRVLGQSKKLKTSNSDAELILAKYDGDNDKRISMSEFISELNPHI